MPKGVYFLFQQLELRDCNGELNQLWLRPGSDLRIQTSNGTCMGVYDNSGQGDGVYVNICNDDDSQKWLYDGTYLRIMYNTSVCLSVDNRSVAKLIIDFCTESSSYMQWTHFTYTQSTTLTHIGADTGTMDMFRCPTNTKVIGISGHYGTYINSLTISCDDDTTQTFGSVKVDDFNHGACSSGFSAVKFNNNGDVYLGDLNFYCSDYTWKGWIMESSGPETGIVTCPQGQSIIGFNMWYSWVLDGLEAVCDMVMPPTIKPTARPSCPSVSPTAMPTSPTVQPTTSPPREDDSSRPITPPTTKDDTPVSGSIPLFRNKNRGRPACRKLLPQFQYAGDYRQAF